MEDTIHFVTIEDGTSGQYPLNFDAVDINNEGEIIPVDEIDNINQNVEIGSPLLQPEYGWKRIDSEQTKYFDVSSGFDEHAGKDWFLNQHGLWTNKSNETVKLQFRGTKLRLIANTYNNKPENMEIYIDGKKEEFSLYSPTSGVGVLVYEKTGLTDGIHSVEIRTPANMDGKNANIDAVDIDKNGEIIVPIKIGDSLPQPETIEREKII